MKLNGLKLNTKKLQFNNCKFFSHNLTPDSLKAGEDKIEVIMKMSPSKTKTELKSFLGVVNYLG